MTVKLGTDNETFCMNFYHSYRQNKIHYFIAYMNGPNVQ